VVGDVVRAGGLKRHCESGPATDRDEEKIVLVTDEVMAAEWDEYVDRHPEASVYHSWAWREIFGLAFGHDTLYLAARTHDRTLAGVLPLVLFRHPVFGRYMVSLPFVNYGGILASHPRAARALLDEATTRARLDGMSHVELRHRMPQFDGLPARCHKVSMTMALAGTVQDAWNNLDRKVRNQVRKAEKSGLAVETGGLELTDAFYEVFAENMRDLGTPVYPRRWFAEIVSRFPARARVFVVRHSGTPVAGAVTIGFRGTLEIPSASSRRSARQLCPNMLLYWHIMQQAITDGYRILDFGRSTPDKGTYHFKRQWGAEPGPMCWE